MQMNTTTTANENLQDSSSPKLAVSDSNSVLRREIAYAFRDVNTSRKFTPDTIVQIFDLCSTMFTVEELFSLHPARENKFILTRDGRSIIDPQENLADPVSQNQHYVERPYERPCRPNEVQNRLQVLAAISEDRPLNLVNNAYITHNIQISRLFQNRNPSSEVTTYNVTMWMTTFSSQSAFNAHGFARIGLRTLCTTMVNTPEFLQGYYPFLFPDWGPLDDRNLQYYVDYILTHYPGLTPLAVLTNNHLGDPLTPVPAPGAIGPDFVRMANMMVQLMSPDDRKMVCLCGKVLFGHGAGDYIMPYTLIPQYDFFNHVIDYIAWNWFQVDHPQFDPNSVSMPFFIQASAAMANLIHQRIRDYTCQPYFRGLQLSPEMNALNTWNVDINHAHHGVWNPLDYGLYVWYPYEMMEIYFKRKLLCRPADLQKFLPATGQSAILVKHYEKHDDRLEYMPSAVIPRPAGSWIAAGANYPIIAGIAAAVPYIAAGTGWDWGGVNPRQIVPFGEHVCAPINNSVDTSKFPNSMWYIFPGPILVTQPTLNDQVLTTGFSDISINNAALFGNSFL